MVLWTKVWDWRHRVLLDIVEFEDRHRANLLSNPLWLLCLEAAVRVLLREVLCFCALCSQQHWKRHLLEVMTFVISGSPAAWRSRPRALASLNRGVSSAPRISVSLH